MKVGKVKQKAFVICCMLAVAAGLGAGIRSKKASAQYTRMELTELFEHYPVYWLQEEFDGKKIILLNPSDEGEFRSRISSLTLEDPKPFEFEEKISTIYSGTSENGEPFAFLENDEEQVLVMQNADSVADREQWVHMFHLAEGTVAESFFKTDADNDLAIKLTFQGEKGYVESGMLFDGFRYSQQSDRSESSEQLQK